MTIKTWDDVERAALTDPVLRQAVVRVRRGDLTREEALIYAVLGLSKICEDQKQQLIEELQRKPFGPIVLPR